MKARLIPVLAAAIAAIGLALMSAAPADAANIDRNTAFWCENRTVTVYFPWLSTGTNTLETVYFSPDLWKLTSAGWQPYDTSKPWYGAVVSQYTIQAINGYKWYTYPLQTPAANVQYGNLPPGTYAVRGYFFQGSNHWANYWGTNAYACTIS